MREVERDVDAVLAPPRRTARARRRACRARVDRVVAARPRRRSPTASRGRRGRRRACCCGPCGSSGRSGGSAAGRATSKPSSASRGSCSSTPFRPPQERGNSSYQAPKRARSRSTSSGSGGSSVRRAVALGGALDRGEQLVPERGVVLGRARATSRPRATRARARSSSRSPVALRALGRLARAARRPRRARRRGRPGRPRPCAAARRARWRTTSVQASTVHSQRPVRSTGELARPAHAVDVRVDGCSSASLPARRPGRGSGRRRAGCRGRRGRRRPDRDGVADAALGRVAPAVDRRLRVLDVDPRRERLGCGLSLRRGHCVGSIRRSAAQTSARRSPGQRAAVAEEPAGRPGVGQVDRPEHAGGALADRAAARPAHVGARPSRGSTELTRTRRRAARRRACG